MNWNPFKKLKKMNEGWEPNALAFIWFYIGLLTGALLMWFAALIGSFL